jgi:molybdopterin/thiamine biosynthesis adenylyltransferase
MSTVREKNTRALDPLFAAPLEAQIEAITIGIIVGPTASDALIADALGDLLGRFWRKISVHGPNAERLAASARSAAHSGGELDPIVTTDLNTADFIIGIGSPGTATINIAIDGYRIEVGPAARSGPNPNPLSALVAACIAAGEALKSLLGTQSRMRVIPLCEPYLLELDIVLDQRVTLPETLLLDDVVICGVGAVTHALLWILERWPGRVEGRLTLVDRDAYDTSNGQRYIGMVTNTGAKVADWARRLMAAHPALDVEPIKLDLNTYFASRPMAKLAIAGLDSEESRRHLALKLVPTIVNLWTSGESAGASLHHLDGLGHCLHCAYPEKGEHASEITRFANLTGLSLERVSELLDTVAPLTVADANTIRAKYPTLPVQVGKPLRSVIPAICSVVPMASVPGEATIDVPLAPVSAYAGSFGFLALLLALGEHDGTPAWQTRLFAYPNANSWTARYAVRSCVLCSDSITIELVKERSALS